MAAQSLESEIAHLRGLDMDGLRARWRSLTGRRAPRHLSKGLMFRILACRILAYRIQADALGDLDSATIRYLERIATDADQGSLKSLPRSDGDQIKPGAVLVREWQGTDHHVMALSEGFAWKGQVYRSLSEVARAITGTSWNGPRFFGLRAKEARP
jgi:hypothetical protein